MAMAMAMVKAVALLGLGVGSGLAVAPVSLRLMSAADAEAKVFTAEYTQTLALEGEQRVDIVRDLRLRWHLEGAAAAGDSVRATARFDSARGSVSSPHGRQIIDLRKLRGAAMPIAWAPSGGPPRVEGAPPAADFGEMMGAPMPVSHIVAHAFPAMPGRPVQAGDRWERTWTREAMDGVTGTRGQVTGRFRLARIEKVGGRDIARIEVTWHGDSPAAPAGGQSKPPGPVDGRGTILIGVVDGVVRDVSFEETTTGSALFGPGAVGYRQTVSVRVTGGGD